MATTRWCTTRRARRWLRSGRGAALGLGSVPLLLFLLALLVLLLGRVGRALLLLVLLALFLRRRGGRRVGAGDSKLHSPDVGPIPGVGRALVDGPRLAALVGRQRQRIVAHVGGGA